MATKKELKEQYKHFKPDMGVFCIKSEKENKYLLYAVQDMKSRINRYRFQLELGSYTHRELQKDWKTLGADNFSFEILEKLEYDKDETKTDYTDDLELLRMKWEEKLKEQGCIFYNTRKSSVPGA